jgi:ribosomal-protein-alanine N-acetyltransferase
MSDAEDVFAYASDEEFARHLDYPMPSSIDDVRHFLRSVADGAMGPNLLAICLKADGRAIGAVQLQPESGHKASLHYELSRDYWGRGLATEAVSALLTWGLREDPSLEVIEASTSPENLRSRRLLEKLGFVAVDSGPRAVIYAATRPQLHKMSI